MSERMPSHRDEERSPWLGHGCAVWMSLAALFFVLRLLLLFSTLDSYNPIELARASLVKANLDGFGPYFFTINAPHYVRGYGLISNLVLGPLFVIFGPSLFSVRLAAVVYSFLTLLALTGFVAQTFGRRPAMFAALLFILAPPSLTRLSMIWYGDHYESVLFVFLCANAFVAVVGRGEERLSRYILFGLVCGVAAFFNFQTWPFLLLMLVGWFWLDRRFFMRRTFAVFALTFFVGYAPALYSGLIRDHSWLTAKGGNVFSDFIPSDPWIPIEHSNAFLLAELPASIGAPWPWANYAYFGLFVASLVYLAWDFRSTRRRKRLANIEGAPSAVSPQRIGAALVLAYPLYFWLLYSVGPYRLEPVSQGGLNGATAMRYTVTIYPFMIVSIAVFLEAAWRRRLGWPGRALALAALVLVGVMQVSLIEPAKIGRIPPYRGYVSKDLYTYAEGDRSFESSLERLKLFLRVEPDPDAYLMFEGVDSSRADLDAIAGEIARDGVLAPYLCAILGKETGGGPLPGKDAAAILDGAPERLVRSFYAGMGYSWPLLGRGGRVPTTADWSKHLSRIEPEYRDDFVRGFAFRSVVVLYSHIPKHQEQFAQLAAAIPNDLKAAFYGGAAWGFRQRFMGSDGYTGSYHHELLDVIEEQYRPTFVAGLVQAAPGAAK
jgi:hypothetical protein